MPGYIVAENRNFAGSCSPSQFFRIVSSYSKKPISHNLSASSMTTNCRSFSLNYSVIYASFKGDAIKISVDETSFSYYSCVLGKRAFLRNLMRAVYLALSLPAPLKIRNSL